MKKQKNLETFEKLFNLFFENGYSLFMVGGTVRDYLLGLELFDMDVVTNATPEDMKKFLPTADYTFARFGSVKYKLDDVKFDITTLRKEAGYIDARHPNKIIFCDSLEEDVRRRDFTINGLYMDNNFKVYDFVGGQLDLENKIIRMIGDPDKRIKEDPLRIIRALRFSIEFGFSIGEDLQKSIENNKELLKKLNPEKVKEELHKSKDEKKLREYLNHLCKLW